MSGLYKKNDNDDLTPKRQMICTRCNIDILTPKQVKIPGTTRVEKQERGHTYYFGELVCLDCYHKIKNHNDKK